MRDGPPGTIRKTSSPPNFSIFWLATRFLIGQGQRFTGPGFSRHIPSRTPFFILGFSQHRLILPCFFSLPFTFPTKNMDLSNQPTQTPCMLAVYPTASSNFQVNYEGLPGALQGPWSWKSCNGYLQPTNQPNPTNPFFMDIPNFPTTWL